MELENKYELILASASPRRKELLSWIDVPFEIIKSEVEEISTEVSPSRIAESLAELKGEDIWSKRSTSLMEDYKNPLIVSSDTVVSLGDQVFGKPKDLEHAREMLLALSGRTHIVSTGIFMKGLNNKSVEKSRTFSCQTKVTFERITEDILAPYLESRESLDKAGSYGIQGKGLAFISHIEGSYSNVVGFPLSHFIEELKNFLMLSSDLSWRSAFK